MELTAQNKLALMASLLVKTLIAQKKQTSR